MHPVPRRTLRRAALIATVALATAACGGGTSNGAEREGSGESDSSATVPGAITTGDIIEHGRVAIDEGEPVSGGRITIAVSAETDGWEPNANRWADSGHIVASSMLEPLATFDADGELVMHLAESIEVDDSGTVWTITLRSDADGNALIKFHDDTLLDGAALAANLEHALYAPLTGLAQREYAPVIEQLDDLTVQVTLAKPWRNWRVTMTGPAGIMRAVAMIENPEGSSNPIGTGAYKFVEWVRESRLVVEAFEDYWGDGPYLDEITFRVLVDPTSRASSFTGGDVDIMFTSSPADLLRYREQSDVQLIEDLRAEETFVMLNQAVAPFDDPDARAAIIMATDQEQINEVIGEGVTVPAIGPFAPGDKWYDADTGWTGFDPAGARDALARYEERTGGPLTVALTGVAENDVVRLSQTLVNMWSDVGIEASIDTVEQATYILDVVTGQYEAAWFRNFAYTDPDFNYIFWHSSQSTPPPGISINFTHTEVPELDRLLDHVREEAETDEERKADYKEIVQLINEDQSYLWLFHTPAGLVARPNVRGLNPARERGGFGSFEPKPWIAGLWLAPS